MPVSIFFKHLLFVDEKSGKIKSREMVFAGLSMLFYYYTLHGDAIANNRGDINSMMTKVDILWESKKYDEELYKTMVFEKFNIKDLSK